MTPWPTRLLYPWDFSVKNIGVGCHSLLQRIFLIQRSNLRLLHLLHGRQIFFFFFTVDQGVRPLPSGGGSFHTDVGVQELEWQLARPLEPMLRTHFLFLSPDFTARTKSHSVVVYMCHSCHEILTFKAMVIGAGAFRRCPGHEGGAPVNAQRESCCHVRFQRKYAICNVERWPPLDSKFACSLTIDFQDSTDVRNKFLLSINHLAYSTAAQTD